MMSCHLMTCHKYGKKDSMLNLELFYTGLTFFTQNVSCMFKSNWTHIVWDNSSHSCPFLLSAIPIKNLDCQQEYNKNCPSSLRFRFWNQKVDKVNICTSSFTRSLQCFQSHVNCQPKCFFLNFYNQLSLLTFLSCV